MGEFSDRLLGGQPQGPIRPPQERTTPEESRFSEQLLGARQSPFAPQIPQPTPEKQFEFDFPAVDDLQAEGRQIGRIRLGNTVVFTDQGRAELIQNTIPGTEIGRDKFNNVFVTVPGQGSFYLNRGFSFQDIIDLNAVAAQSLPAARAGAGGMAALGAGGRIGTSVGVGAAEGALSVGQDVAAQQFGVNQPIDPTRAATAAVAGAGGELLLPAVASILRSAGGSVRDAVTGTPGNFQMSPAARQALEDAGLSPDQLNQEFLERLNTEIRTAATPAEAVRLAEAGSLPTSVPLTRGDVTRTAADQMFEDQALKGTYGRTVASIVRGQREAQQTALRSNVDTLQENIAGQPLVRDQGGVIASDALNEARREAENVVQAAYRTAENAGQAGISGSVVPGLVSNLERAAGRTLRFSPGATDLLNELRKLGEDVGPDGSVLVGPLFDWRRDLTRLTPRDPTEALAFREIKTAFDSQIVDIVERGLLEGNQQAVDLWLAAIRSRREFGDVWEAASKNSPNYLVDRLTAVGPDGSDRILNVPSEAAANFIFGASKAGLVTAPQMARQLQRLRSVLQQSGRADAWDALRGEAFVRLVNRAEGPFDLDTATRSFSGANFANAIDDALTRNSAVMRTLFTREEINLMEQIKRTALATTTTTRGGQNFSNTASGMSGIFQSVFGRLVGKVFGPAMQGAIRANEMVAFPFIVRSLRGVQSRPGLPAGVGGAASTVFFSEPGQEVRQEIGQQ